MCSKVTLNKEIITPKIPKIHLINNEAHKKSLKDSVYCSEYRVHVKESLINSSLDCTKCMSRTF